MKNLTALQESCPYCHIKNQYMMKGADLAIFDSDEFRISKTEDRYFIDISINIASGISFTTFTRAINFCPMCGRRLSRDD